MAHKTKPHPQPPLFRNTPWLFIALIAFCGFLVYANTLSGKFLFDDEQLVFHNAYLRGGQHIADIFTKSINQGAGRLSSFYRPVQIISYAVDHAFWKLNPTAYHWTNIFWHVSTALLLFWFLHVLLKNRLVAFWTSLFFAVHPVHTEAVAYISGRADSLAAAFLLCALTLYIKLQERFRLTWFFLMLASYALALLSRENALILPFLALLIHGIFRNYRIRLNLLSPLFIMAVFYIALRFTVLRQLLDPAPSGTTMLERLPGFFSALMTYARILVCPLNLHMEYGTRLFSLTDPQVGAGALLCASSLLLALRLKKTFPVVAFAIFWFYLTLLPSSNIYPINAYLAEHWLYLPSIGFFLLLSLGLQALHARPPTKKFSIMLLLLIVLGSSFLTIRQNMTWLTPEAFYARTLTFAPDSSACYTNLGRIYDKSGRRDEAIAAFQKAIEVDPERSNAYSNLAVIYGGMGQHDKAVPLFEKAVALNPRDAKLWSNLGAVYSETGRIQDALRALEKALEMDPHLAGTAYNLVLIYERIGETQKAAQLRGKIQKIDPHFKAERVLERAP